MPLGMIIYECIRRVKRKASYRMTENEQNRHPPGDVRRENYIL
jgi:hypothetical protein